MRPRLGRLLAIALFFFPTVSTAVAAQSGFHPRWEIPGFDFRANGGWRVRARAISAFRRRMLSGGKVATLNEQSIGPSPQGAMAGSIVVPTVFFAYKNTDSTLFMTDTAQYNAALFGSSPPGGNPYTLRTFYAQMSNNQLTMTG